jgi:PAS domain S-box-containing protein
VADYAAVFDMLRRLSGFETAGRPKVNPRTAMGIRDKAMTKNTHDPANGLRPEENRARPRQLFEGLTDVCFALNADLRFTFWNPASEELVGIPEEEVLGKSWPDLFPLDTECGKTAAEALRRVLLNRTTERFLLHHLRRGKRLCLDGEPDQPGRLPIAGLQRSGDCRPELVRPFFTRTGAQTGEAGFRPVDGRGGPTGRVC